MKTWRFRGTFHIVLWPGNKDSGCQALPLWTSLWGEAAKFLRSDVRSIILGYQLGDYSPKDWDSWGYFCLIPAICWCFLVVVEINEMVGMKIWCQPCLFGVLLWQNDVEFSVTFSGYTHIWHRWHIHLVTLLYPGKWTFWTQQLRFWRWFSFWNSVILGSSR